MKATQTNDLPGAQVEIAFGQKRRGKLVGLTTKAIYLMDADSDDLAHTADARLPLNCGFALVDDAVYFGSKSGRRRYWLPRFDLDTEQLKTKKEDNLL
ncbi:MAG: hypothetical protein DME26_02815 [Verrucomicrobia bacterium]|nr:MAG: hypothetical protein DME26_02815 [Verrucomicrobiota bacterium]